MGFCGTGNMKASALPEMLLQVMNSTRAASNKATGLEMPGSLLKM